MSLFESVWTKLACERCGEVRETIVRFHSYSGRLDGEYQLMEVAPRRDGLSVGEVWEGNADRYCDKCYFDWSIAQATAAYDALAELIERGSVTARAKSSALQTEQAQQSSTPLPASAINKYADKYVRELRSEGGITVTMPYFEELDLTVGDKPVTDDLFDSNSAWTDFLGLIEPLLSARLTQAGWVTDDRTCEDFHVSLDNDRRVIVRDIQGRRLTRDGTRVAE